MNSLRWNAVRLFLLVALSFVWTQVEQVEARVQERVNIATDGAEADNAGFAPVVSDEGRYVAFCSSASTLVAGDGNGTVDVFVRDRKENTTTRVSVSSTGVEGDLSSGDYGRQMDISGNGRYVVFKSSATTLVDDDTNGASDIFLHDLVTGSTVLVSRNLSGAPAAEGSYHPSISTDGRYVVFNSSSSDLVASDTNSRGDVFVRDLTSGTTTLASVSSSGEQGNQGSEDAVVSGNGRYVVFESCATNLVDASVSKSQIYRRDLQTQTTELVSCTPGGAGGDYYSYDPVVSPDGRYVVFYSGASDLVAGDENEARDVFLRDMTTGLTVRISQTADGVGGDGDSTQPSLSPDGRFIAFRSKAKNLADGVSPSQYVTDVLLYDRENGTFTNLHTSAAGTIADTTSTSGTAISEGGHVVVLCSAAKNLVPGDTNDRDDVFVALGAVSDDWDIQPTATIGGWRNDMTVRGNYAYLNEGYSVSVYDISGAEPAKVSTLPLTFEPATLHVHDGRLYMLGNWEEWLAVADLSDPSAPVLFSTTAVPACSGSAAVYGDTLFYTHAVYDYNSNSWTYFLQPVDVSDPENPSLEQTIDFQASCLGVEGQYMYVVGNDGYEDNKLWVFDLSAGAPDPAQAHRVLAGGIFLGDSLHVEGTRVYTACGFTGVQVFRVDPGEQLTLLTTYAPSSLEARDVYASGTTLYVAGGNNGLAVLDVSDYNDIQETGRIDKAAWTVSGGTGGVCFMSPGDAAVQKVTLSGGVPAASGGDPSPVWTTGVLAAGSRLYASSDENFWVYDISDPDNPVAEGMYDQWAAVVPAAVAGNVFYGYDGDTFHVLDVADPAQVSELGTYQAGDTIKAAAVSGGLAFLLLNPQDAGAEVVSVATPSSPGSTGAGLPFSGQTADIHAAGSMVFIAGRDVDTNLVRVYDLSNPQAPQARADIEILGGQPSLASEGSTLFVSSRRGDYPDHESIVEAFDLTDPAAPVPAGVLRAALAADDIVVAADGDNDPIVLAAVPGGSVHTYGYSRSSGSFYQGPYCPSPYSHRVTTTPSASGSGYTVITSDYSYGTYIQEITRTPSTCCVETTVSPAEAATAGCSASPVHSGEVECESQVNVTATEVSPWNFSKWTGAATCETPECEATASAHCSVAVANFVKPVLTLTPGSSNPDSYNTVFALEEAEGYRITDETLARLTQAGVPGDVRAKLRSIKWTEDNPDQFKYDSEAALEADLQDPAKAALSAGEMSEYLERIFLHAQSVWAEKVLIAHAVVSVNEVDDWRFQSVTFHASGTGNELSTEDVLKVTLEATGHAPMTGTYSQDNGDITFALGIIIGKGESVALRLYYDFDGEKACPCNSYQTHLTVADVNAVPLIYPNYVKLPPLPQQVVSGPTRIKPGEFNKDSGDQQYGPTNKSEDSPRLSLESPLKVKLTWEDRRCTENVEFSLGQEATRFGATFKDGSTEYTTQFDGRNEASAELTLGERKGKKNPYYTSVTFDSTGAECSYPIYAPQAMFTSWGLGVELPTTAKHDATGTDDEVFATFLSVIQAENEFTCEIDMAPEDFATVEEVLFTLAGETKKGTKVADLKYMAKFDMGKLDTPQTLTIVCKMTKDGEQMQEDARYTVRAIKLPDWVEAVHKICNEESYSQEFNSDDEQYEFEFSYPTDFAWKDSVPGDIGLLGGLDNDIGIEFTINAKYKIDQNSEFGAVIKGNPKILGQEFEVEGALSGSFDPNFSFQRGNGSLNANTGFDLPKKGYSKTFVVYGVPITVAVDLSGNVVIYVNGSAVLNKKLEFETVTVTPGTTVTGHITVSLSAVFGLAKLAVTGSPSATVEIQVKYTSASGTEVTWGGKVAVPIKVVGSLFWGLAKSELYSTTLGPWSFGAGVSGASIRPLEVEEGPEAPVLLVSSALAVGSSGRRMLVWVDNTAGEGDPPNPDVFFRYYDGTTWTGNAPVIGQDHSPDLLWEMDPAVVFMEGGAALAAWTSNSADHALGDDYNAEGNAALYDILDGQDIAFAVWNGTSWTEPGLVIDDDKADGTVRLAWDGGNGTAVAVWVHDDTEHDPDTEAGAMVRTGWKLMYAMFTYDPDPEQSAWSVPGEVTDTASGSADFMPAVATDGAGNLLLVWARDEDGAFHEELDEVVNGTNVDAVNHDADIYWSRWTGDGWSTPAPLTEENDATEFYPSVAFAPGADKAVSVWVERGAETERLVYRVFDVDQGTWDTAGVMYESGLPMEDPHVVVDAQGTVTVVWRGYRSGKTDLFLSRAMLDTLDWSEPEQITDDEYVDWSHTVALSADGRVVTGWSTFDPETGEGSGGTGVGGSVGMAVARPESAALTGVYSDGAVDVDDDGLYDYLTVTAEALVYTPGTYGIKADLFGASRLFTARAEGEVLTPGTTTFELLFPGGVISNAGADGPYYLKNVVLLDMNESPVQTAFEPAPYTTTGAYSWDLFAPGPLSLDENAYSGSVVRAVIAVKDVGANTDAGTQETVKVTVSSAADPTGFPVTLTETEANSGVFTALLGFNFGESLPWSNILQVTDHCLVQVVYDDTEPAHRWMEHAVWFTDATPGDFNVDGLIDLADVIIALQMMAGADTEVEREYTASEMQVDDDLRVGMREVLYVLQAAAGLRQ